MLMTGAFHLRANATVVFAHDDTPLIIRVLGGFR
jgi:hypothetical protein